MTQYDSDSEDGSGAAFFSGLLTGAVIGAGLALWFAPRSGAEFRGQVSESARAAADAVSKTVDGLTESGREVYDKARDVASRAGAEIDRMATEASKSVEKGMDRARGAASDAAAAAGSAAQGSSPGQQTRHA